MSLGEFDLIEQFFKHSPQKVNQWVDVGVGDDAAILSIPPHTRLVACKDLLIEDRHFFPDDPAHSIGHKALAVNLSDLAAMGATPVACLLGIGLPESDPDWLGAFSDGFLALADSYGCSLIGGDTVLSPQARVISVTALGTLPLMQTGIRRDGAKLGDDIWVSGQLASAHLALSILMDELADPTGQLSTLLPALRYPNARVELGQRLLGLAHAAIDISDGLVQDLSHLLKASGVGALLQLNHLPIPVSARCFADSIVEQAALYGGDVYELCFTAPGAQRDAIGLLSQSLGLELTCIGVITDRPGVVAQRANGTQILLDVRGFDHFKGSR
jgi:thiamine-monophosphate kinase